MAMFIWFHMLEIVFNIMESDFFLKCFSQCLFFFSCGTVGYF